MVTLEGLGTLEKPHALQRAFIAEQAAQCGYCTNGMIMTAKAFLDRELPPLGAGEAGLPPVPAAIANAFFNATGKRLRDLPFDQDRIRAALT